MSALISIFLFFSYSRLGSTQERELIPFCNYTGVGLIPWGPVAGGNLTRPIASASSSTRFESTQKTPWGTKFTDADAQIIQRVEELAKKKGWSMVQVALAWVTARVSAPIVGISSVKRLEENIIPGYVLSEEEKKYLEEP